MFRYFNRNPHKREEEDCVCRAISTALALPYQTAERLLTMSAEVNECDSLCVCCYHFLLEDIFGLPCRLADGETVGELAECYKFNKLLIRIDGHLTCSIMGTVLDIWDCTREPVDCYWII